MKIGRRRIFLYVFISFIIAIASIHLTTLIHEFGHCAIYSKYNVSCKKIGFEFGVKNNSFSYRGYALGDINDIDKLTLSTYERMEKEHEDWDKTWDFKVFASVTFIIVFLLLFLTYLLFGEVI